MINKINKKETYMEQELLSTEYDGLVQTKELQILKSMLPFANPKIQMPLAILIESLQIQNTIKLFRNDANLLSACSVNNEPDRKTAMIQTLRKFCTPKEKETIDTLLNIMCVMENYDAFTN